MGGGSGITANTNSDAAAAAADASAGAGSAGSSGSGGGTSPYGGGGVGGGVGVGGGPGVASFNPVGWNLGQGMQPMAMMGAQMGASYGDGGTASELSGDETVFTFRHVPPRRLFVIGGVHITQFLAPMARQAGYDVVVIDPRAVFNTEGRFPGLKRLTAWPDEALAELPPDERTAIVTLTHDPKIDDPGLLAALASKAFYIGCLGSRRTHAARCDRLREAGFSDSDLARLHGPVGLDIGARTPAEIAVSILAQMIAVERRDAAA